MLRFFSVLVLTFTLCLNGAHASEKHVAEQEFQTGVRFLYGLEGTPRDFKKGYQLLLKAAEKEHPVALYCLASCFLKGEGVEEDHAKARILYQQSADFDY